MSDLVYRAKTTAQIYKGFSAFGILFIIVGAIFKFVSTKMVKLVRSGVETTTQKLSSGGIVVDIGAHYEKTSGYYIFSILGIILIILGIVAIILFFKKSIKANKNGLAIFADRIEIKNENIQKSLPFTHIKTVSKKDSNTLVLKTIDSIYEIKELIDIDTVISNIQIVLEEK